MPASDSASAPATQRVEISGKRSEDEQRREATASKIVIGRDELDKFGDTSLGEVMKRLPGVSTDGRAGRGGGIRMRGLGGGYTQILLDGERVQGGLSLDTLSPDDVERIEIIRAPTAETGARAIAGTINIITRSGYVRRANDLKLGLSLEQGRLAPNAVWSRSDTLGAWSTQLGATLFAPRSEDETTTVTQSPAGTSTQSAVSENRRVFVGLNGRANWKGEDGDSAQVQVFAHGGRNENDAASTWSGSAPTPFAASRSSGGSRFSRLRLNGQWRGVLAGGERLEVRGGVGQGSSSSHSTQSSLDSAGALAQTVLASSDSRDRNATLALKLSTPCWTSRPPGCPAADTRWWAAWNWRLRSAATPARAAPMARQTPSPAASRWRRAPCAWRSMRKTSSR